MAPLPRGHNAWKKRGKAWHTPLFLMQSTVDHVNANAAHCFGLVVRKRIGSAVQRNRIKRRLRSVFFCIGKHHDFPLGAWSYVLIVKSQDVMTEPFDALYDQVLSGINGLSGTPLLSARKKA